MQYLVFIQIFLSLEAEALFFISFFVKVFFSVLFFVLFNLKDSYREKEGREIESFSSCTCLPHVLSNALKLSATEKSVIAVGEQN